MSKYKYENLPDYTLPYIGDENYTGPYLSDGKFQSSVEFGKATPRSKLDTLSRLHDSAYARYQDRYHRQAADELYERETKKLKGAFPELAGDIVKYGNFAQRSAHNLLNDFVVGSVVPGIGNVLGLIYGSLKNNYEFNEWNTNKNKYIEDVKTYYSSDPLSGMMYNPYKDEHMPDLEPIDEYVSVSKRNINHTQTPNTDGFIDLSPDPYDYTKRPDGHRRIIPANEINIDDNVDVGGSSGETLNSTESQYVGYRPGYLDYPPLNRVYLPQTRDRRVKRRTYRYS